MSNEQNNATAPAAPATNRHWTGRFAPGNVVSKGAGRASRATEAARLATIKEVIDEPRWRTIIEKAYSDAIGTNWQARERGRRFIADYLVGKPAQTITLKAVEQETYDQYNELSDDELRAIAYADDGGGGAGVESAPG